MPGRQHPVVIGQRQPHPQRTAGRIEHAVNHGHCRLIGPGDRGATQEEQVGSRTILDVLDARSNLVVAIRNEVIASVELRQKVGTLTARTLALPVTPYDPEVNCRKVRWKWWGMGIE